MGTPIVVACSTDAGLDAPVDPHFGRAAHFVIADSEDGSLLRQLVNDAAQAAHGAGTGAAGLVGQHHATAVLAGNFGPKAYQALTALGVEMWLVPTGSTVRAALAAQRAGELEQMKVAVY